MNDWQTNLYRMIEQIGPDAAARLIAHRPNGRKTLGQAATWAVVAIYLRRNTR